MGSRESTRFWKPGYNPGGDPGTAVFSSVCRELTKGWLPAPGGCAP